MSSHKHGRQGPPLDIGSSNDLNTPLSPDGAPLLRDAWRYLLTAQGAGHEHAEVNKIASEGER